MRHAALCGYHPCPAARRSQLCCTRLFARAPATVVAKRLMAASACRKRPMSSQNIQNSGTLENTAHRLKLASRWPFYQSDRTDAILKQRVSRDTGPSGMAVARLGRCWSIMPLLLEYPSASGRGPTSTLPEAGLSGVQRSDFALNPPSAAVFQNHIATMAARNGARNGQAQPRSASSAAARIFSAGKWLEHAYRSISGRCRGHCRQ